MRGVSLKMYSSQIFALIGHNGAGKSTTIGMLTGLIRPSAGAASIFGFDLFSQMHLVRQSMGVCPQHDIYFPNLTPLEHIFVFQWVKGSKAAKKERNQEAV